MGSDPAAIKLAAMLGRRMDTQSTASTTSPMAPAPVNRAALEAEAARLAGLPERERWTQKNDQRLKEINQLLSPGNFNRFGGAVEGRK